MHSSSPIRIALVSHSVCLFLCCVVVLCVVSLICPLLIVVFYCRWLDQEVLSRSAKRRFRSNSESTARKGFVVSVVDNAEQALSAASSLITEGASVSVGGSTTLTEIGLMDFLKSPPTTASKFRNIKGEAVAARVRLDLVSCFLFLFVVPFV